MSDTLDMKGSFKTLLQKENPEYWIKAALANLTPDRIIDSMEKGYNPIINFFDTKYLNLPGIKSRARAILRNNWGHIDFYLLNPENTKTELLKHEGNSEILNTEPGTQYLNNMCSEAYSFIRELTFEERIIMLNTLKAQPRISLTDYSEICGLDGIPGEMIDKIIREFQSQGVLQIYVELNRPMEAKKSED